MSYADRQVRRAYEMVKEFARDKVSKNIPPDLIHKQVIAGSSLVPEKSYDIKTMIDGWVIAMHEDQCIVGLEDGGIVVGLLKFRALLFRWDRSKAYSYSSWHEYNPTKCLVPYVTDLKGPRKLPVDIADAVIGALAVTV